MKKIIYKLSIILCAVVFVYSVYQLGTIFLDYQKIENETEELIDEVVKVDETKTEEDKKTFNPKSMTVDFDKLLKKNKDVVGWIMIPDTNINEALLLGETNDTYLRTNIDKKKSNGGSLFLDCTNNGDFKDKNTILYGHNMKNGSKFHHLRHYINKGKEYMDTHSKIYIYLPDGSYNVYEVFAACVLNETSALYSNPTNYKQYIKDVLANAKYKTKVSDVESPLIMLSTCHSSVDKQRYVVYARLSENVKN